MAYKPPKQTIIDNDLKGVPSNEAVFEGLKLKLPKPSVDGTSGQLLSRGATADDTSWVNPPGGLPSGALEHQVLVYDGAAATWAYPGLGDGTFGNYNIILGQGKPAGLASTYNILIGTNAGASLTTGDYNTIIGNFAGSAGLTETLWLGIGPAQRLKIDQNGISIGSGATGSSTEIVSIGYNASVTGQGGIALGSNATAGLVGTSLGRYTLSGTESLAVGHNAQVAANAAVAIGAQSGGTGQYTIALGYGAKVNGNDNITIGYSAGGSASGTNNIFIGSYSGISVAGSNNVILGNINTATISDTIILAAGSTERIRHDATKCAIKTGDLSIETAGKGLAIKSGTNAKIGTAQFTAQTTVTVNTTAVTANSLIFVTGQDGIDNYAVQNKVAGTSFEIHHNGGNVTALVAWMIVEATP